MFKKILVATDFSDASKGAMRCARELAAQFGLTLHVTHVVMDPSSQPWAAEAFAIPLGDLIPQWVVRKAPGAVLTVRQGAPET